MSFWVAGGTRAQAVPGLACPQSGIPSRVIGGAGCCVSGWAHGRCEGRCAVRSSLAVLIHRSLRTTVFFGTGGQSVSVVRAHRQDSHAARRWEVSVSVSVGVRFWSRSCGRIDDVAAGTPIVKSNGKSRMKEDYYV